LPGEGRSVNSTVSSGLSARTWLAGWERGWNVRIAEPQGRDAFAGKDGSELSLLMSRQRRNPARNGCPVHGAPRALFRCCPSDDEFPLPVGGEVTSAAARVLRTGSWSDAGRQLTVRLMMSGVSFRLGKVAKPARCRRWPARTPIKRKLSTRAASSRRLDLLGQLHHTPLESQEAMSLRTRSDILVIENPGEKGLGASSTPTVLTGTSLIKQSVSCRKWWPRPPMPATPRSPSTSARPPLERSKVRHLR